MHLIKDLAKIKINTSKKSRVRLPDMAKMIFDATSKQVIRQGQSIKRWQNCIVDAFYGVISTSSNRIISVYRHHKEEITEQNFFNFNRIG